MMDFCCHMDFLGIVKVSELLEFSISRMRVTYINRKIRDVRGGEMAESQYSNGGRNAERSATTACSIHP